MSQTRADVTAARRIFKLKRWLYKYRPRFRDWHFWAVQALIIAIAGIHDLIEAGGYLPHLGMLYFVPISLFFVPVVYAALNFGFAGSIATALWAVIITIPNWVFWHDGLERWGVMFQMVIVVAVALFVGQRVDRETGARRRAEAAGAALRASEMKYRGLFESSSIAILVLDTTGTILESNPAASVLFNRRAETLKGMVIADLIGTDDTQKLLVSSRNKKRQSGSLTYTRKDGSKVYLEPTLTQVSYPQGNFLTQVLFRDVTEERHRQAGLKAYAAHVLRAQEEERQRIARELHDDTIQALVLLCRQLDSVETEGDSLPSWAIHKLREIRRTPEEVVRGLRDFTTALRPPILDDLGLIASIRRLLMDFTERTNVEGEIKVTGAEQKLLPDTRLGMYRIAQEALWNVEHHAKATRVVVTIAFNKREASLEVIDNGVGFAISPDTGDMAASDQLGLIGMQERAELLGGKLGIQSEPGKGTKVTLSVPVPEGVSEVP